MNGRSPQNLLRDTDGMGNPMGDFDPSADAGANPGAGVDAQPEYLNNKCSYPAFVGEKLYEYWAIIEMLYLLSTDANARAQFVENMQGSAAYHAMVSMGAGQMAADQNMAAGSLALWEYFGVVKKGTAEKMLNEGTASAELSREHGKIAADKIVASLKEYVDAILKRYDDCGLLYAIATLSTDGVFFVADLALGAGAGALAVKGLKFVALRVAKTGAIAVTATSSAGGILRRTFSREALEAKYGKAQKNHMGVLEKDKNLKPSPGDKPKTSKHRRGKNENEITYDSKTGRPISEQGTLREDFGGTKRGDNATAVGKLGQPGDQGGHLVGHRFMGDTPDHGIAPQAGNLNTGAWKTMENEWADWIKKGYEINYKIDAYPPGSVRPDSFNVKYTVRDPKTGAIKDSKTKEFKNKKGEKFKRTPFRDME
jgi:hypothetical protein